MNAGQAVRGTAAARVPENAEVLHKEAGSIPLLCARLFGEMVLSTVFLKGSSSLRAPRPLRELFLAGVNTLFNT